MTNKNGTPESGTVAAPPVAKKVTNARQFFNHTLQDDYAWLREKESPEVIDYLKAENAYTDAWMKPTAELQKKLYAEMLSHIKETDESVPYRYRNYYYYTRTTEGKQYATYCRKYQSLDAPEQVILDVNELAQGEQYMSVGAMTIADDNNLLAYTVDNTGFRQYTLHIKNLSTGELLPDTAERVGSVVWAKNLPVLFYSVEDDATKRQHRLFRHTVGDAQSKDVLVFVKKQMSALMWAQGGRATMPTWCWRAPVIRRVKSGFSLLTIRKVSGN